MRKKPTSPPSVNVKKKASDESLPNEKKEEEITPRVITCDACAALTHANWREKWREKIGCRWPNIAKINE